MAVPMKPIASAAGTASNATGTTAVAFPFDQHAAWQYIIINRGGVELQIKTGPSTGPDANSTTDGWPIIYIPSGNSQTFTRSQSDTHFYVYAGSSCAYAVISGSGE